MQRWTVDTDGSFAVKFQILSCSSSGVVSDVKVYKTYTGEAMEVVCTFIYFKAITVSCMAIFMVIFH